MSTTEFTTIDAGEEPGRERGDEAAVLAARGGTAAEVVRVFAPVARPYHD